MKDELILEAARLHRDSLPEPERKEVDHLLEKAAQGQAAADALLALLRQHEAPRQWLKANDGDQSRDLRQYVPGPVHVPVYECPYPGCPTTFRPTQVGMTIPTCLAHGEELVRRP